jgi:hypothetical protein
MYMFKPLSAAMQLLFYSAGASYAALITIFLIQKGVIGQTFEAFPSFIWLLFVGAGLLGLRLWIAQADTPSELLSFLWLREKNR